MLRNYIKVAWRYLLHNKVYSVINITGLAIGITVCMLIVIYLGHESSYDSFHKNADRICRVQAKLKLGGDSLFLPYMTYTSGPTVKQNEPLVESFLRIKQNTGMVILQNGTMPTRKFAENNFLFADSNFFRFFSFPLLRGDKDKVLQRPFSLVISQKAAQKYFGNDDPVGKTLRYDNAHDFIVTGIAGKVPSNSSIEFEFVAAMSSMAAMPAENVYINSSESAFTTYFRTKTVRF